ncbi:MAG: Dihydrolipoyllysine-residue acetyltransferase component of pyruvate dehydrogenase complex [Fimbriimonadaceae bacterium]|nr:Dihydrolipoyllysine-residue acetyltransferase component of pyruvate dehydrogenase complex [Fimbriimonadaceae bacterium]
MPVEILMPELGEGVHEGTVSRWLKKIGEFVKEDEPIVEIMTDKVNTELPSPASGVLTQILIKEGEPVEVFHAMGLIDDGAQAGQAAATTTEAPSAPAPKAEIQVPAPETKTSPADVTAPSPGERRWYSPVVRSMAKANGIAETELAGIKGSGAGGRVNKKDLEAFLASRSGTPASSPAELRPAPTTTPPAAGPETEIVPLAGMRKMIAEAMVRSSQVPTVSTLTDVDVTKMVGFRSANKDSFQAQFGVKFTYTPFFIKALTEALQEFPLVNSSLQDGQIHLNRAVHMGVAVALGSKGDEGLIVPVIRDCHKKGLIEIAKELEEIASKARSNSLAVADVQGGTFTLTNPGSYGAVLGTPMINAPQAGILGTYTIQKKPVIVDDMIGIRSIMNLVLTYDHRIVDGLLAGRFLQSVKAKLEAFDFFR